MNWSPPVKGFIFALLSTLMAFGIYFAFLKKKNYYLVDNPTTDTFYFKINNGKENIITSGQSVKVDLEKGQNSIRLFNNQKKMLYDSSFTVKQLRGLINITHQDYYIYTQYYGYFPSKDSLLATQDVIKIDGKDYLGGAKHFNGLYTDQFYYNVDEDYDKVIKNIQKVETRTKIFRKQDFINYYKKMFNP